ncbi:MAG: amino acid-binding protein [Eubacteriales bacterium]|nr:amino acid-binding protein [Eubacteriales bacterium]
MLKQLSIFAENQKGIMQRITDTLQREGINILGSVTNDSAEYGIVRMVVSDCDRAMEALAKAGFICKLTDVLGIEVKDEVGNLNNLLLSFLDMNVSIDYLYLSFNRDTGRPIMVIHVEDITEVEAALTSKGFTSL